MTDVDMTDADRRAPFAEPFTRFSEVFARAAALPAEWYPDPNAMTVSTVDDEGRPSSRIVLLKAFDERGFVFYTNFHGRKGRELLAHPAAALCFHWPPLAVQVRIEGDAERVSDAEADAYFATRARLRQVGAWASSQSERIEHEGDFERRIAEVEQRFAGQPVPRPPHWSGYRVVPARIEFWHNRPNRLHERHVYVRDGAGWHVVMIYP
jgi:pyridoxamine 5'-phosphate oxidase